VILFELLTGHVPFDADSAVTIALKHVSEAPPAPTAFDPSVPPALEAIVLWALQKDPAQRPADADTFIGALEQVRDEVLASETSGQRTAMFAPLPVTLPAESDAYAADLLAPAGEPPPFYADTPAHADPEDRRRPPWWVWLLGALALAAVVLGIVLLTQPGKVAVRNVVGQDVQVARASLRADGLSTTIVRSASSRPVDRVLAQDPGAGAQAKNGSTVTLTVSSGPGDVAVPTVDGLSQQRAVAKLTDAGLVVDRVEHQADDTAVKGDVIRSSPAAGVRVQRGSDVTLFVSSGPNQLLVPDVTGLTQSDAQRALTDQGFKAGPVQEASDTAPVGTVIRQTPAAGAKADPGATVTIVVASAPAQVTVPDVTGMAAADAVDALSGAGLEPRESTRPVTDETQDGLVLDQRPSGGTKVKKGAPVRIVVGQLQAPTTPTTPSGAGGSG
jgi:serine/threonine-protein kinase